PSDATDLSAILAERRNDLTEAAMSMVPEIAAVLERLVELPGMLLARMSGSGATCFALFPDRAAAVTAERTLCELEPDWWIAARPLLTAPPAVGPVEAGRPHPGG